MTFARRLVLGTVLVLLFTILVLIWSAERSLRRNLESDVAETLLREARLVREALPADTNAWAIAIHRFARQNGIRIVLVDRAGHIRADSDQPGQVMASDSESTGADLETALTDTSGPVVRRDADDLAWMYVSVPGGPGVIQLATTLTQVDETVRRAQGAVLGGALVALAVGSLLALVAGRSITRPLGALVNASRAIAAGSLPRFPRSGVPDIDGLVQALREMHRQLADRFEDLRRERAETAALVESMTEGVIAADQRGRITTANAAARRLLGYDSRQNLPDLPELFRAKALREVVDAVLGGTPVRNREVELDDSMLIVNARPLSGGAVLVLHDVTELRRLEAVRRDFVANVSHELKTPLTSISGYAETILTDRPEPELERRFLDTIANNARRMQRLVDDLLDLSRIESGRWQPATEWLDVAASAREAWGGLADRAAPRGVELVVDVPPEAASVEADPDAVRQVLTNLFDNSLRYTPRGGRITFQSRVEGPGVRLSVSDTGPGIASEHLPRIFERFYRADQSRSREEGGTGLGLAIVKHLVEAHDGRVWAESERGRGTTVHAWFPHLNPHDRAN